MRGVEDCAKKLGTKNNAMRTMIWMIGGTLLLALQAGLAPRLELWGARPDWLLAAVIFFALHVQGGSAAVGAWCLGFSADLMTLERPGLLAITYTVTALLVTSLREYVFRMSVTAQFAVTFATGVLIRSAWLAYRHAAFDWERGWISEWSSDVLWGAAYTAAFAPPIHRLLTRLGRQMGMRFPRYSHAGMTRR